MRRGRRDTDGRWRARRGYRRCITEPPRSQDPAALRQRLLLELTGHARSSEPDTVAGLEFLCRSLVADSGLAGAIITMMARDGVQGTAAASDAAIRAVDAVQFDVGEGPSRDAFATGRPVLAVDLTQAHGRWPGFVGETLAHGIGAVYAFPLQLGAIRLGVLTCYADRPRALTVPELSACAVYAEVGTQFLIERSSAAGPGVETGFLHDGVQIRTEVYQAQGMVMVDLGVSLAEALVRLRAAAFAADMTLNELAGEVVTGRRSFAPDGTSLDGPVDPRPPPSDGDEADA